MLKQEFLPGVEDIVNSVSHQGKHYFTDTWRKFVEYKEDLLQHDYADLVIRDSNLHREISTYVSSVLDVLGIQNEIV